MKRLLVVMLLMLASGARADIYTWKDSRGIAHYTNKEYEIPARYRAKAKPLNIEAVQPGGASSPQQAAPPQPQPQPQPQPTPPQVAPPGPAPQPAVTAPGPQPAPTRARRRIRSADDE